MTRGPAVFATPAPNSADLPPVGTDAKDMAMRQRTSPTRQLAAVLAICALVLASCNDDDATDGAEAAPQGDVQLTFTSWGGIYQDAQVEAFVEPFIEETGIDVVDDPTLEYAQIQAMVDAGNVSWDVVTVEGFWAVDNCDEVLLPLDEELVDLSGIQPGLIQSECAAPLLTYLSSVYYNTDTFDEGAAPAGCDGFFDTENFPGTRAAYATAVPNALLECALLADGVEPDDLYPLDVDRAFGKIESIQDDLIFWNVGADSEQLMSSGEVDVILAFNGRAYAAIDQQGAAFAPAYGESIVHYDAVAVPRGARNPEAAMRLIDSMMDPERQAHLTTLIPYPPAHASADLQELDEGLELFLPDTNPRLSEGTIVQDQRWWAEHAEDVTRRWSDTFQG